MKNECSVLKRAKSVSMTTYLVRHLVTEWFSLELVERVMLGRTCNLFGASLNTHSSRCGAELEGVGGIAV